MSDKYKLATTGDELAKRCTEMENAIKQLKRYNHFCFTSLTQQVFSAILRSRQAFNELQCKEPKSNEEAIKAQKCLVDNAMSQVQEAERKMIVNSQVILDSNIADNKLRMRRTCCSVIQGKKLFMDATKEKCSAHEKLYSDYVDSYTSEAFSLTCEAPEKLECDKLEALKVEGVQGRYKFFLNPVLMLAKTLDA